MSIEQIFAAPGCGDTPPLGNIWRITAKETDFYLDPLGEAGAFHLSAHGPNDRFSGHRFHVKPIREQVVAAQAAGSHIGHNLPRKGYAFDGQQVAERAFRVARIRWTWDLQRPKFRAAAISADPAPTIATQQLGLRQAGELRPNEAWDVDFVVSYDRPHWPNEFGSQRANARVGPLLNDAQLWLTGTSYRRSQSVDPTPSGLTPRLPRKGERPIRLMTGAPGVSGASDMYWFVESIAAREDMK